ncbi:enoyl-CoA hydratase-related protein [Noviherbaspirillum sedimenti]|uniref:Enoyl-CoA hydratase n=1 Tax=Noviherbaspirillum sedimenti TaxID=2320865 RepID=A0A3A3G9X9_9BURK|nr:enoyl-CoA hydratase-related protein [Noviherbaspirillum sedimenti]RJG04475.1 enoyl-CoA hydratase [Noviherbaspirillum sedimenti]
MSECVLTTINAGIGSIVLNRPDKANALDQASVAALRNAIDRICADRSVRVVLIRATGKTFCSGGDISNFKSNIDGLAPMLEGLLGPLNEVILKLANMPVPVISVLNGPVGGGGIGLALVADFVLAAQSMKLRGGYSAIGLTPDVGSSWFLTRRVGPARAREIFILNRPVNADDCLASGVVDAIYPDDQLAFEADKLAESIAAGAAKSIARIKALVNGASQRTLHEQLALEREYMVASGDSADAREGITAFLEKRAPRFGPGGSPV